MTELLNTITLDRCPHCSISAPNIELIYNFSTTNVNQNGERNWRIYVCRSCGGVITGAHYPGSFTAVEIFPKPEIIDESIPYKAREYLTQAANSLHSPAGSIMLSASSIDAMLKEKGYLSGKLYNRIDKAAEDHFITKEMAKWAHQVRLESNDQRHADESAELPNQMDAQRVLSFTLALAQFLYVLPEMVIRGLKNSKEVE